MRKGSDGIVRGIGNKIGDSFIVPEWTYDDTPAQEGEYKCKECGRIYRDKVGMKYERKARIDGYEQLKAHYRRCHPREWLEICRALLKFDRDHAYIKDSAWRGI